MGALGPGGTSGGLLPTQQYDSLVSLVELRRPANRGRLDTVAIQAAKLAKARRVSGCSLLSSSSPLGLCVYVCVCVRACVRVCVCACVCCC